MQLLAKESRAAKYLNEHTKESGLFEEPPSVFGTLSSGNMQSQTTQKDMQMEAAWEERGGEGGWKQKKNINSNYLRSLIIIPVN